MNTLNYQLKDLIGDKMETIKVKGRVDFKIIRRNGEVEKWSIDNLIVSAGKAAIAGLVGNTGAITAFSYLAVGSSNTAVSIGQTALQAEISTNGLTRASASVSRTTTTVTNDTLTLIKSFSVSGSSTVEEIGVFNDPSAGIMLGRALTGSKSVVNGDTFLCTYNIIFS